MDVPLALCLKNCVMGRPGIVQLEEGGSKGECVQDPGRGFLAVRLLAPSDPSRGPQGQNWFCLFVFSALILSQMYRAIFQVPCDM